MPYVGQDIRQFFERHRGAPAISSGELAYKLAMEIKRYLDSQQKPDYALYASVIGVLETLKMEINRRLIAPYEQEKIKKNGDVF